MPKTDGEITKKKILEIAEKLFSENGFDATSIESISKSAGINKATIYYHFKDKQDIILSLFFNIIQELDNRIREKTGSEMNIKEKIKEELLYLMDKRDILSVMFMEALKDKNSGDALFQCASTIIENERKEILHDMEFHDGNKRQLFYIHEFFTGILPVISFVVFRDKWSDYFNMDNTKLLDDFIEVFEKAHLNTHYI